MNHVMLHPAPEAGASELIDFHQTPSVGKMPSAAVRSLSQVELVNRTSAEFHQEKKARDPVVIATFLSHLNMPEVLTVSRVRAMSWVNLDVLILSQAVAMLLCCALLCFPVLSLNRDPGTFRGFWVARRNWLAMGLGASAELRA